MMLGKTESVLPIRYILIVTIGFVIAVFVLISIRIKSVYQNPLENIPRETEDIPNYVVYSTLYSEFGKISVGSECVRQNKDYELKEIFCVKSEKVYFIYSVVNESEYYWAIGSIDLGTMEFQTHCKLYEPKEAYDKGKRFFCEYKEQNGYLYDDEIVLTDYETVLIYDLNRDNIKKYDYGDFLFPQKSICGEYVNSETIVLKTENISKMYTLQEMAAKSESIAEIFSLSHSTTWSGASYLCDFFSNYSVQAVGNKLYAVGQCLNNRGYAYAVILEYDEKNDLWNYVANARSAAGDIVHGECYVIP